MTHRNQTNTTTAEGPQATDCNEKKRFEIAHACGTCYRRNVFVFKPTMDGNVGRLCGTPTTLSETFYLITIFSNYFFLWGDLNRLPLLLKCT